jgi:hypothetical protein
MNTIKVVAAVVSVATTVVLLAGIGALVQKAENDAYASIAKNEMIAQGDRTVVVVTRNA